MYICTKSICTLFTRVNSNTHGLSWLSTLMKGLQARKKKKIWGQYAPSLHFFFMVRTCAVQDKTPTQKGILHKECSSPHGRVPHYPAKSIPTACIFKVNCWKWPRCCPWLSLHSGFCCFVIFTLTRKDSKLLWYLD